MGVKGCEVSTKDDTTESNVMLPPLARKRSSDVQGSAMITRRSMSFAASTSTSSTSGKDTFRSARRDTSMRFAPSSPARRSLSVTKLPFVATFSPNMSGDFDITDRRIHPTCFEPNVVRYYTRERVASVRCTGLGLREAVAGNESMVTVKVTLKDGEERPRARGRETAMSYLGAYFRMGPGMPHCSVEEIAPLTFEVRWTPPLSGTYSLAVHFAGVPADGSPFQIHSLQAVPQARTSYVLKDSIGNVVAGTPSAFIIVACDQHANPMKRTCDSPFDIRLVGPDPTGGLLADGLTDGGCEGVDSDDVDDDLSGSAHTGNVRLQAVGTTDESMNGAYRVRYTADSAGTYGVAVTISGEHIVGSPFALDVSAGSVCSPDHCRIISDARVLTGTTVTFEIVAHDAFGNPCTCGGESFHVRLLPKRTQERTTQAKQRTDESAIDIDVVDKRNGRYACTYHPTIAGAFVFDVKFVKRNRSLYHNPLVFGSSTSLIPCSGCAKEVHIMAGPTHAPSSMVEYSRTSDAWHSQRKDQQQQQQQQQQESLHCDANRKNGVDDDGGHQAIESIGDGGRLWTFATTPLRLMLRARDCNGNLRAVGGDACEVAMRDASTGCLLAAAATNIVNSDGNKEQQQQQRDVADESNSIVDNDGCYEICLSHTQTGRYSLSVMLNNEDVLGSPFDMEVVPGAVDIASSSASGPGLEQCFAGESTTFTIFSKDVYANHLAAGGSTFKVSAIRKTNASGPASTTSVRWRLATAAATVDHSADALGRVGGDGVDGLGETSSSSSAFNGTTDMEASHFDVVDVGDGTYCVNYYISESGMYQIRVTDALGDSDIAGSPFEMYVQPSFVSDPTMCRIEGDGANACVAGRTSSFTIVAVDRQGNSCVKGGESFRIALELDLDSVDKVNSFYEASAAKPLRTSFEADVTDNKDGTYAVRYILECAGLYTMTISHSNGVVCVRRLRIAPSVPDAVGCEIVMYNSNYVAGESARFLLLLADVFGNRIRQGLGSAGAAGENQCSQTPGAGVHLSAEGMKLQLSFDAPAVDNSIGIATKTTSSTSRHSLQLHRQRKFVDAVVSDNNNGTCSVQCIPVKEGSHNIILSMVAGATPVTKASIHVGACKISPENCVLCVVDPEDSLMKCSTGGECQYHIISYDRFKNRLDLRTDGTEAFQVYCRRTGSSSIDMSALDNITVAQLDRVEVGVYRARFTLIEAGDYELTATFSEESGDAVTTFYRGALRVVPGGVWPARCAAAGYGLGGGVATAKETFFVKVKDRFNNPRNLDDGCELEMAVTREDDDERSAPPPFPSTRREVDHEDVTTGSPRSPCRARIRDAFKFMWTYERVGGDEGTYRVSYTIDEPGNYSIHVSISGTPIDESPFDVVIKAARCRDETERYLESVRQYSGSSGVLWDPDTEKSWRRDVIMPAYALPEPIAARANWDDITPLFLKVPSITDADLKGLIDDDTPENEDTAAVERGDRAGDGFGASPTKVRAAPGQISRTGRSVHRLSFTEKEITRLDTAARYTQRKRSTLLHMQIHSIENSFPSNS